MSCRPPEAASISTAPPASDEKIRAALAAALHPKYALARRLGEGGMGSVYLATEVALGRPVAVKLLTPLLAYNQEFRQRFEREARAAAGISHPNVVQVFTVGEIAGELPLPYIIMQYVDGSALDTLLLEQRRLPERRARRVLRDVAAGLAAAHQRDLVHRDIKPGNILIERLSGRAFVTDFGISAALSPRAIGGAEPLAEAGVILGTPPYMSPEQTQGDPPGPPSDVYSLGIVAYQALSGTMPYSTNSVPGWMAAHQTESPVPLRDRHKGISADLARLVERCLAKDPGSRPSAAELARELLPSTEDEILWPPPGLTDFPQLGRRIRRSSAVLAAMAMVLLGALALRLPGVHTAAGWWEAWPGGGVVAQGERSAPHGGPIVLWQAVVLVSALALVTALGRFAFLQARALPRFRELEGRGWRRETILDALADPDGRTGLLLSGSSEFATTPQTDRERTRRFRRLAHSTLVFGGQWIAVAFGVWALSMLIGAPLQPAGGPAVGLAQLLVVLLPLLGALAVCAAAMLRERRSSGRSWRRQHSGTFAVPSDSGVEEVADWYAEVPGDPGPRPPRAGGSSLLLVTTQAASALLIGWTVVALGLLLAATLGSGRLARQLGPATSRVAASLEQSGITGVTEVRHAVRGYQPSRTGSAGGDANPLATLLATGAGAPPAYAVNPRQALGSRQPALATTTLVADALRRSGRLSSDTLTLLAALAEHPRTLLLRAAAHRGDLVIPLEGDTVSALRTALEANAAGAVLHAARRNWAAAAERLGENAVLAELALTSPARHWTETGLRMMHSLVLLPLVELERLRGDGAREAELRHAATSVAEAIDHFGPGMVGAMGLASDPRDLGLFRRLQADSTLPVGFRRGALEASGDVVCLNPREWLSGADPVRLTTGGGMAPLPEPFHTRGIGPIIRRIRYCAALTGG